MTSIEIKKEKRRETKRKLLEYRGGKCEMCGKRFDGENQYLFDLHHNNPEDKSFSLSSKIDLKFNILKEESEKCSILCKLCHATLHYFDD